MGVFAFADWRHAAGAVFFIAVFLHLLYQRALPKPLKGIPYNVGASKRISGDLPEMLHVTSRRQWIWSQPRVHGAPLAQFLLPLRPPIVVVTDYREVVDILTRRNDEFDRSNWVRDAVGITAPNFHFTMRTDDPRWAAHRGLLKDLMTPAFLNEIVAPRIYERSLPLLDLWRLKMRRGNDRPFEASNDIFLATLDIICAVAFGMDESKATLPREIAHIEKQFKDANDGPVAVTSAPVDPEMEAIMEMPEMMAIAGRSGFPWLSQRLALLIPRHFKGWYYRKKLIRRHMDRSIRKLVSEGEDSRESALDQLLWREMNAAKKAQRAPQLYSPVIRDETLGYLIAGHDTTAAVTSWWVKWMARHPEVQTRLRKEMRGAHKAAAKEGRNPSLREIIETSITYFEAVIEETLRFASVAIFTMRRSTVDTQILGYRIPKGTDLFLALAGPSITEPALSVQESHRSATAQEHKGVPAWDNDDIGKFIPERWLRKNDKGEEVFDVKAGPTLAFSVGQRQCFGRKQALMEMRILMTLLLWNFEFLKVDEELDGSGWVEKLVNPPAQCYVRLRELHDGA